MLGITATAAVSGTVSLLLSKVWLRKKRRRMTRGETKGGFPSVSSADDSDPCAGHLLLEGSGAKERERGCQADNFGSWMCAQDAHLALTPLPALLCIPMSVPDSSLLT